MIAQTSQTCTFSERHKMRKLKKKLFPSQKYKKIFYFIRAMIFLSFFWISKNWLNASLTIFLNLFATLEDASKFLSFFLA